MGISRQSGVSRAGGVSASGVSSLPVGDISYVYKPTTENLKSAIGIVSIRAPV